MKGAIVLLVLALAACTSADPPVQAGEPATSPSVSPSPQFRPAKVGEPFDIAPWRITVTSIKCGTAHELLGENDDNGREPGDRVCVAFISYTNIDTKPHSYSGFDVTTPQPVDTFLGFAGEAAYTGTRWAREVLNPGLSQTNELIFPVAAGVVIDAVQIGDVLIKP
jgi:hypothetical protein